MKILAVETATSCQSVVVISGTQVLSHITRNAEGSHAKYLSVSIDQALRTAGLSLGELDGFALSIGPGSFTGLRVGLATLLGFRTVLNKPLVAVPTLEAMAWNVRGTAGQVCPVLKSRKNEVYWARYEWTPDQRLRTVGTEEVGSPAAIADSVHAPVLFLGNGWQAYKAEISSRLGSRIGLIMEAPEDAMTASAASVAFAARERFDRGEWAAIGIAPHYVQRAEADLKFEAGGTSPLERRKERIARRIRPQYARTGTPNNPVRQKPKLE